MINEIKIKTKFCKDIKLDENSWMATLEYSCVSNSTEI